MSAATTRNRVLAVRLDGLGDVLLTGPALRAATAWAYASLSCPRICGSPTTIESRLAPTLNKCRTAARAS